MLRKWRIELFCLLLLLAGAARAQNFSTMGTDFWVTFFNSTSPQQAKLFLTGKPCTVWAENPNTGWVDSAIVERDSVAVIEIPLFQCQTNTSGNIRNTGIHVTSTDSISLYSGLGGVNTYESSNVYPTQHLRASYIIQTYRDDFYGPEFVILATVDSTVVDIIVSCATTDDHQAGDTITVSLNTGQCYQLTGDVDPTANFSGTRIKARDCKPIAVFEGNLCAYIPTHNVGQSCDMLYEQSIPTEYWGNDFIVRHTGNTPADYVQVLSKEDSCTVWVSGTIMDTLAAGASYQFTLDTNTRYIHTDKPVTVSLYMGSGGRNGQTDPSMVHIHPIDQMITESVFTSDPYGALSHHYITVVTFSADIMNIKLDGVRIAPRFRQVPYALNYSCANITLSPGSHKLEATDGSQFTAYVYGGGQLISYAYSLGASCKNIYDNYIGSAQMGGVLGHWAEFCLNQDVEFYLINSGGVIDYHWSIDKGPPIADSLLSLSNLSPGYHHVNCNLTLVEMECYDLYDTLWLDLYLTSQITLHDADTIDPDQLPWSYRGNIYTSSTFFDTITLTGTGSDCDTLLVYSLLVRQPSSFTADTVACAEDFPLTWHGYTFAEPSTQRDTLTNALGYDSILTLTVHSYPPLTGNATGSLCEGVPYYYEHQTFTDTGLYDVVLQSTAGCDSLVHLHVVPAPSPVAYIEASPSVVDADDMQVWLSDCSTISSTRQWLVEGALLSTDARWLYTVPNGADSAVIMLIPRSSQGCTDTALTTIQVDHSVLWVPNTFTPDQETNTHFAIVGNQLLWAEVSIFDRKGLHITTFDGLKESWDGTYQGVPCPEGAYVYLVKYIQPKKPRYIQTKIGTVTLLR